MTTSPLIVLGMHRSGTSALMRVLNLLGVELGAQLLAKHPTNETGFWEWLPMVQANEKIFQTLHSQWFNPLPLPEQWWQLDSLDALRIQMTQVLSHQFANCPFWGIKDPRLCRLLPFWLPILESLGTSPKFVIIARHPEEVAASLKRRQDFFLHETSLWLWLTYVLEAEQYSRPYSRVWITYDELLADWPATVTKIATELNLQWPNSSGSQVSQIQDFLAPSLKHHHYQTKRSGPTEWKMLNWSQTLYSAISEMAQGHPHSVSLWEDFRQELDEFAQRRKQFSLVDKHYLKYLEICRTAQESRGVPQGLTQQWPTVHCLLLQSLGSSEDSVATTLASLQTQTYPHWRVHFASTVLPNDLCNAEWVALLYAGDTLVPWALRECVQYLGQHPQWRLIYTDEDCLASPGENYAPHFKPDFNLDLLRSTPYVGSLTLVRLEAWQAVGGYANYPGLETTDLCLKIWERYGEEAIGHVPQVLCHRATSNDLFYWPLTTQYALELLQQHFQRLAISAQVYETDFFNLYCIEYPLKQTPLVSLIISTRHDTQALQRCIQSIVTVTSYPHYEIIVVENQVTADSLAYLAELQNQEKVRVVSGTTEMNISNLLNLAVSHARGEVLCFLNDDSEIIQPSWLQELLSHCQRPEVGAVGPRLLSLDHRLLHSGFILGMGAVGVAGQVHQGLRHDELGYQGRNQVVQNFSAISETGLLIEKSLYLAVGGLERSLNLFNEIDFCLKIMATGQKIVWTPFATLLQHGPGSVLRHQQWVNNERLDSEVSFFHERWLSKLRNDPAYHPHLSLQGPEWQPEVQLSTCNFQLSTPHSPRVVAFPYDHWGCGEYRVRAPVRALQQVGLLEYALMPTEQEGRVPTPAELARLQPETVLFHNTLKDNALWGLEHFQQVPCFKILGQDDLLFALPKANPYRRLNYRDLKPRIRKALSYCDRLLVTTEPLAEVYQYLIRDIQIIPNYLERSRWESLVAQRRVGRKPRVGWAGAAQHQGDLQWIIPLVITLAEKEEVEWVFFGMCPAELRPYVSEYYPMVPFDEYPAKLASLNLDVAIAPLEIHPFNEAKSNLRLLEYGILGWPVICSDIYPYQTAPVCRVANTLQAWLQAVREHIYDLEATEKAGETLRRWVKQSWMLEDHLEEWATALNIRRDRFLRSSDGQDCGAGLIDLGGLPVLTDCMSTAPLIFLLGADPTSIHLLESFLSQFSTLVNVSETNFYAEVQGFLNGLGNLAEPSTQLQPTNIPQLWTEKIGIQNMFWSPSQTQLLRRRVSRILKSSPKARGFHSSALHLVKIRWLQEHFPDAQFIHIVRNGYAVALELRDEIRRQYGVQPLLLSRTARQWARSLEFLQAEVEPLRQFLEIRYEELVTSPHSIIQQLIEFLNLTGVQNTFWTPLTGVQNTPLTSFQNTFWTPEQQAVIEQEAGEMLARYNYLANCH